MIILEDCFDVSIQRLEDYIEKRGGRLIAATRNIIDDMRINRPEITRKQKWEVKQLYGQLYYNNQQKRENFQTTALLK